MIKRTREIKANLQYFDLLLSAETNEWQRLLIMVSFIKTLSIIYIFNLYYFTVETARILSSKPDHPR